MARERECFVPDRVHAREAAAQATHGQSVIDRAPTESQVQQLAACHDALLACSERRDRVVGRVLATNVELPHRGGGWIHACRAWVTRWTRAARGWCAARAKIAPPLHPAP